MTFARSGFAVVFFALAMLCGGAGGAQAQTFNFQVCNRHNVSASVAIDSRTAVNSSQFQVEGWWTVPAGTCLSIGNFPQGWFYYYAEQTNSGQIYWQGNFPLCVVYPGPFDYIAIPGNSCPANQLKLFTAQFIPNTTGTFTWNLE